MPSRGSIPNHDAAWKQFFALPIAVEHLLAGFYPEVAQLLDFDTLRDVAGEFVGDGKRRRADSVWRADYRDGSGRSLVLLLEFQSKVDLDMSGRVLGMLGLAHHRAGRANAMDQDGRFRTLCIVIHSGRRKWTAPGAAERLTVSREGEVLLSAGLSYAALDARRHPREHLPGRNAVATLFGLARAEVLAATAGPLAELGAWLPDLGRTAEALAKAYGEWLAATSPQHLTWGTALELVERFVRSSGDGQNEEEGMAYTAFEENFRRKLRRTRREGVAAGMSSMLRKQMARKFGDDATRAAAVLEGLDAAKLERAGELLVDSETADELVARLGNSGG